MSSNNHILIVAALVAAAFLSFPVEGHESSGIRLSVMTAPLPQIVTQTHTEFVPVWQYVFIPVYYNNTEYVNRTVTEYVYVTVTPAPTPAPTNTPTATATITTTVTPTPAPTTSPTPTATATPQITPVPTSTPHISLPENVQIFDRDSDGRIDKSEAIRAINTYFLGVIGKSDAIDVIEAYFNHV